MNIIKLYLKTYKIHEVTKFKTFLNFDIDNILNQTFNKKLKLSLQKYLVNKKEFIQIKKKVNKYIWLRATHEFKYSWEKYKETIYKYFYSVSVIQNNWLQNFYNTYKRIIHYRYSYYLFMFNIIEYKQLEDLNIWCKMQMIYNKSRYINEIKKFNFSLFLNTKIYNILYIT